MNRPEVYALRGVELTGTNTPRPFPLFSVFLHFVKESGSWGYMNWISGGQSGGVTPGSMPNPAVKPSSADGTAEAIRGRVGRCRKSFFYWITDETEHCEAESFRPRPEILRFFRVSGLGMTPSCRPEQAVYVCHPE